MKFRLGPDGKPLYTPFYVDLSLEDYGGDTQAYSDYLYELETAYRHEKRYAEAEQPVRSQFPQDDAGERAYNIAVQRWSTENAFDEALEKHDNRRKAEMGPDSMPRELAALYHGDAVDKKRAKEIMEARAIVEEQARKANEFYQLDGHISRRVKDARERCAQYQRYVTEEERKEYNFEAKKNQESVEWGDGDLEKDMKLKPEEVAKNLANIQLKIDGFRKLSDTHYSYALDQVEGGYQVVKVNHDQYPANQLEARLGTTEERHILLKLQGNGIERHEEPTKEEPKAEAQPVSEAQAMRNYDRWASEQNAKEGEANSFVAEVRPGMFGG
jgi:hypothetical protein